MLLIHPMSIGFSEHRMPARHGPRNIVAGRLRGNPPFSGEAARSSYATAYRCKTYVMACTRSTWTEQ